MSNQAKKFTHVSQLRNGSIYMANGKLCRYLGRTKAVRVFPFIYRQRPVFCGHAVPVTSRTTGKTELKKFPFTAKITEVQTVDNEGVRAYLGRRPDEAIGGANKTGICERVRRAIAAQLGRCQN